MSSASTPLSPSSRAPTATNNNITTTTTTTATASSPSSSSSSSASTSLCCTCDTFTQNAWRPDLCSTCQRSRSEHDGVKGSSGSESSSSSSARSWRRRSEPDPNSNIAGVRISALASKFQGRELRSGSIPEAALGTVQDRAKTLDRHHTKSFERKINSSRSSELLDPSSKPSSSSSSSSPLSSGTVSVTSSATVSKNSCVNGPLRPGKTAALAKSRSVDTSEKPTARKVSHITSTTTSLTSEKNDVNRGRSLRQLSSPQLQQQQPQKKTRTVRRVSIPDALPDVIGEDGGLDNLVPEHEEVPGRAGEETDPIYMSLTDEEKQFALLALGNTVWNADTRNLQVELDAESRRACREFEDLHVDQLWTCKDGRFNSLVDCDKVNSVKIKKDVSSFGTFPQVVGSSRQHPAKVPLGEIHFERSLVNGDKKVAISSHKDSGVGSKMKKKDDTSEVFTPADITESLYESIPDDIPDDADSTSTAKPSWSRGRSTTAPDSAGGVSKGTGGRSGSNSSERGSGGSGRGGRKTSPKSQAMSPPPRTSTKMVAKRITLPSKSEESKTSGLDDSLDSRSDDNDTSSSSNLNDSTAMEGFRAIALLNDVLRDYGDLNESSTDDFFADTSNSASKSTKKPPPAPASSASTDFEAKMASVAATLDLTKQGQRGGKRQAPRPPVSPPPEPSASPKRPGMGGKDQPEPVFKMVPVGRSIMTLPPSQQPGDPPLQLKSGKQGMAAPAGLEELVLASEGSQESLAKGANGDGRNKKGITSFFRSILRRGKDSASSESFDSVNTEVHFERKDSTNGTGLVASSDSNPSTTNNSGGDEDETLVDGNDNPSSSSVDPRGKCLVLPPGAAAALPLSSRAESGGGSSAVTNSNGGAKDGATSLKSAMDSAASNGNHHHTISTTASSSSAATSSSVKPSTPSPTSQRKHKGLASPKMMLKKATAKFSPPASRHAIKAQSDKDKDKDTVEDSPSVTAPSAKPYPAPKPVVPPPAKPSTTSAADANTGPDTSKDISVRRRAKSPKRNVAPIPSSRTSVGQGKPAVSDLRNPDLAKELERRLSKTAAEQSAQTGTLSREGTRRSMPIPPPSPPGKSAHSPTTSPPVSPIRETDNSFPSSPTSSLDFFPASGNPNTELSGGSSTSTFEDDAPSAKPAPLQHEKIELPTAASSGRKGFLGKLTSSSNRKSRAPNAPSSSTSSSSSTAVAASSTSTSGGATVKRAKSITESATLPRGDKKNKKINVADISGPVMVTDITNTKVLENRRNTISLGDEPAFIPFPGAGQGSASSGVTSGIVSTSSVDKGGLDEFDFPVLSPLGSLENLYESILPKHGEGEGNGAGDGSTSFHFYDPPINNKPSKPLCPNIPADGYLEPVPPLTVNPASGGANVGDALIKPPPASTTTTTSVKSLSSAIAGGMPSSSITTNLSVSSSSSSSTSTVVVTKSPLKSSSMKKLKSPSPAPKLSQHLSHTNSAAGSDASSSSEPNTSAENSGENSLPIQQQSDVVKPGLGVNFVEPEMTEQRRALLAAQPIYEEIPNSGMEDEEEEEKGKFFRAGGGSGPAAKGDNKISAKIGGAGSASTLTKAQAAHAWLQQPHVLAGQTPPPTPPPLSAAAAATSSATATLTSSPSHHSNTRPSPSPSSNLLSCSMSTSMTLMTASLTSSMLPPPPPPPDTLPAPPLPHQLPPTSRSISRETVSSNESDSQSVCSSGAGNFGFSTLPRPPRPAPRRRPTRRPDPAGGAGGSDQYVSMNRPNAQVSLSEDQLRDVFTKLTNTTFHALQDVYAQCERLLSADRLEILSGPSSQLKWQDFDIYGQPLHASGRCVVYNAKIKANSVPCQIMILHSRPATEMCPTSHPSLLRPSAVFADTIPFSFLTPDFIKTSQLLQNSVYDSSQARCFVAVGAFDIVESLPDHLCKLRETLGQDPAAYLHVLLIAALQLLSAMSHCLDQGFSVTEMDYEDVFLVTRADLRGKVVAFLPHQRSLGDVPQGEAMCSFLDRLCQDGWWPEEDDDLEVEVEESGLVQEPGRVVRRLRALLEAKRVDCLGHVRTAVEFLLWGPTPSDLSSGSSSFRPGSIAGGANTSMGGREQELYIWLEKERASTVGRLARSEAGLGSGLTLDQFYTLKFLLKSSAACLAESVRRLAC